MPGRRTLEGNAIVSDCVAAHLLCRPLEVHPWMMTVHRTIDRFAQPGGKIRRHREIDVVSRQSAGATEGAIPELSTSRCCGPRDDRLAQEWIESQRLWRDLGPQLHSMKVVAQTNSYAAFKEAQGGQRRSRWDLSNFAILIKIRSRTSRSSAAGDNQSTGCVECGGSMATVRQDAQRLIVKMRRKVRTASIMREYEINRKRDGDRSQAAKRGDRALDQWHPWAEWPSNEIVARPDELILLFPLIRDGIGPANNRARKTAATAVSVWYFSRCYRQHEYPATSHELAKLDYERQLREMNDALLVSSVRQHELIEQAQKAEAALRESEERLALELAATQRLQAISTQLIHEENVDALHDEILDAAITIMGSDMASIQIIDKDKDALRMLAWRGFDPAFGEIFAFNGLDAKTSWSVARSVGHRVVVPDVETCDFIVGTPALEEHRKTGIRAVQSTPLISRDGQLVGMLSTHWRQPHQPSERDLRLFESWRGKPLI